MRIVNYVYKNISVPMKITFNLKYHKPHHIKTYIMPLIILSIDLMMFIAGGKPQFVETFGSYL